MATVSTRIDENIKKDAEQIANEIGIPLGTAINIFIKRFVANKGFPFSVVAQDKASVVDVEVLNDAVKKAIANSDNSGIVNKFTYLDPATNELITVNRED